MSSRFAPVVLFVYNRPQHTLATLKALERNLYADQSKLLIFSDGPQNSKDDTETEAIREVRRIIRSKRWCSSVEIFERKNNWGLAKSIVEGVTHTLNSFDKVIVLEDDIVTSSFFLKYMNDALDIYEEEERVMHISGYMYSVEEKLPQTFFIYPASCWGWATWKRSWKYYNHDAKQLREKLSKNKSISLFDFYNSFNHYEQLLANSDGVLDTWAVKWYASIFLAGGLSLHPYPSLVKNIGLDGSGTNFKKSMPSYDVNLEESIVTFFPELVATSPQIDEKIREYFIQTFKYKSIFSLHIRRFLARILPKLIKKSKLMNKHLGYWK